MNAICFNCGAAKASALSTCQSCSTTPRTKDEEATSIVLTSRFLADDRMRAAAQFIRNGQQVPVPPELGQLVQAALEESRAKVGQQDASDPAPGRRSSPQQEQSGARGAIAIAAVLIGVLFIVLIAHPKTHFTLAARKGTPEAYRSFASRNPGTELARTAISRARALEEPADWNLARTEGTVASLRSFLDKHPQGQYSSLAKDALTQVCDQLWETQGSQLEDIEAIKEFLEEHPEFTRPQLAIERISDLLNDWRWVRNQDRLDYYRIFAENNPHHKIVGWIEKRIIDLEVEEIASGDFGELPPMQRAGPGLGVCSISVENSTEHTLFVRYSGPESHILSIPPGQTQSVDLPPSQYRIAATVDSPGVSPFYGVNELLPGDYGTSFYISREFMPANRRSRSR